jgi:hypothetical protein
MATRVMRRKGRRRIRFVRAGPTRINVVVRLLDKLSIKPAISYLYTTIESILL